MSLIGFEAGTVKIFFKKPESILAIQNQNSVPVQKNYGHSLDQMHIMLYFSTDSAEYRQDLTKLFLTGMFNMENLIYGIAHLLNSVLTIYFYIVIASALISWFSPDPYNPIVRFLRNTTEPVYDYIRRYLPFLNIGGIDLSPVVLILIIQFIQNALVKNLVELSY